MKQVRRLSEKTVRDTVSFMMKKVLPFMGIGLLAIIAVSAVLGGLLEGLTFWKVFKAIFIVIGCFVMIISFLGVNVATLMLVGKAIYNRLNPIYQKYVPEVKNDEGKMEKPELQDSFLIIIPLLMALVWIIFFGAALLSLSLKVFLLTIVCIAGLGLLFAIGFLYALGRKSIGEIWGGFSDRVANHAVKRFGASGD